MEVSLNTLVEFKSQDINEEESMTAVNWNVVVNNLISNTKESFADGYYWLGGQIKMNRDDLISMEKIHKAKLIGLSREELIVNSFEKASVETSKRKLLELERVVITYNSIMRKRNINSNMKKGNIL